jgi:hypothetical protein
VIGTKKDYAAHRRKLGERGTTERAIDDARKDGRLSADLFDGSRVLDFAEADRQWDANTLKRDCPHERAGAPADASAQVGARDAPEPLNDPPLTLDGKPMSPRQLKEHFQAKREEQRYLKDAGHLIPRVDARAVTVDAFAMARAEWEVIPTRLSDRLVGLSSIEIRTILAAEVASILGGLAHSLRIKAEKVKDAGSTE